MTYVSTAQFGFFDRIRAVLADISQRAGRARLYRSTVNELSALSGRELADLGIDRSEIKSIAYEAAYAN